MKKPYFMECQYCGRYPDPDRTDCKGCGSPLECHEESGHCYTNGGVVPLMPWKATAGESVTINPVREVIANINVNHNAMSVEKFDAAIRNWLGA